MRIRPNKIKFVNMLRKVWNAIQMQDIIKMIPQKDFPKTINRFSPKKSLKAHFSKYGPWASSKCITWELVINAGFGLHP